MHWHVFCRRMAYPNRLYSQCHKPVRRADIILRNALQNIENSVPARRQLFRKENVTTSTPVHGRKARQMDLFYFHKFSSNIFCFVSRKVLIVSHF